jgi:hypothetical protein
MIVIPSMQPRETVASLGGLMKKLIVGIVMLFGALLTGCAPSVLGGSAFNPIKTDLKTPAVVTAGSTWYVKVEDPLAVSAVDLKTQDQDLEGLFQTRNDISVGNKREKNVNWVALEDTLLLQEGWGVELVSQIGSREIAEVGTTSYQFYDHLDLIFAIRIPASAEPREYTVLTSIRALSGAKKAIPVIFSVKVEPKPAAAQ